MDPTIVCTKTSLPTSGVYLIRSLHSQNKCAPYLHYKRIEACRGQQHIFICNTYRSVSSHAFRSTLMQV